MKKIVFISITFCLLLCGCNQTKKVVTDAPPAKLSGFFTVISINGEQIDSPAVLEFKMEDARIWGNAGCNDFAAGYTQRGNLIDIDQFTSTKAYCEGAMKNELAIQRALRKVGSFDLSNTRLILYSVTDKKQLLMATKNKEQL